MVTRYFRRLPVTETVEAAIDEAGDAAPVLHECQAGIVGLVEVGAPEAEAGR